LTWFYFPGKGRFILSLAPRPDHGFVRSGTSKGNLLSFRYGSDHYQVKSAVTIFGADETWNLYVLRDPSFAPRSDAMFGSSKRLEQLF
jgi:hypothetical protein